MSFKWDPSCIEGISSALWQSFKWETFRQEHSAARTAGGRGTEGTHSLYGELTYNDLSTEYKQIDENTEYSQGCNNPISNPLIKMFSDPI